MKWIIDRIKLKPLTVPHKALLTIWAFSSSLMTSAVTLLLFTLCVHATCQARCSLYLRGLLHATISKLLFMATFSLLHHSLSSRWVQSCERGLPGVPYWSSRDLPIVASSSSLVVILFIESVLSPFPHTRMYEGRNCVWMSGFFSTAFSVHSRFGA